MRPPPEAATAGPSGVAPLPPPWLARRSLPIVKIGPDTPLYRVHQLAHGAVHFGPAIDRVTGTRGPPTYRFDSLTGRFGVLYAAAQFEGAFVETVLRNPQRRFVSRNYVDLRAVTELRPDRELRLVDLHGRGLSRVGTTNAISTGPYGPSWAWSDYLWSHRDSPDGIAYASRHNPQHICFAIFERMDLAFTTSATTGFTEMASVIADLLRRYDKIMTRH